MTNNLSNLDLAYIAGFFDGEGSITIHENCKPSPRGKNPNHTLQVSIGNTDPQVLKILKDTFGGSFLIRKNTKINHRTVAQWIIRAALALKFLEEIRPFLKMKTEQVDIAIQFQKTKKTGKQLQIPIEIINWREEQRAKIRNLNAKEHILLEKTA